MLGHSTGNNFNDTKLYPKENGLAEKKKHIEEIINAKYNSQPIVIIDESIDNIDRGIYKDLENTKNVHWFLDFDHTKF